MLRHGGYGRRTTARARLSTLASPDFAVSATATRLPSSLSSIVPLTSMLAPVSSSGTTTMAQAGRYVTDWAGDAGALVEFGVRFSAMVVVPDDDTGATIEVSGTIEEKLDGNLVAVALTAKSGGAKVLSRARAVVRLP